MNVDYTAIIADLVTVAQGLLVKNQELERRISVLEDLIALRLAANKNRT
ncbi:hypothetical protein [Klebsiella phage Kpn74]|uniref:Tail fiber protein n=1 Tax=Klebsiella phage Kpn74 TaxID=3044026 RepID=A0AAT9V539_9CAUD|nr:hypothetical protein [Klebsiella phage Kpn74]